MKLSLFLHSLFSVMAEESHPPETQAFDPFAGGATPLTTILLVLLLIIVIWLLLRSQVAQVDTSDLAHDHHGHDDHGHDEHLAEAAAPAPTAGPDDLKVLEGVGPKVQSVLNAAGITTYAQLAETAVEKLQEVLDAAGYQYMNPGSWPEQAALAAAGDWDALKKLQDELNAGRE